MNLFDKISLKIKWLRTQPESVKTRYVWVSALIVFAIVVSLWAGFFRKYERTPADNGKNSELIKEGEKLKKEIENKIKVPDIKLPPKETPAVSPLISPKVSPVASPKTSSEIQPKAL